MNFWVEWTSRYMIYYTCIGLAKLIRRLKKFMDSGADLIRSKTMLRRKAFTLVELLVVIAIMAILLTLLTPALQKAREQAKFVKCNTNVKALQYATVQYFLEYDKGFVYIDPETNSYDLYLKELNEYIDNVDKNTYEYDNEHGNTIQFIKDVKNIQHKQDVNDESYIEYYKLLFNYDIDKKS